MGGGSINLVDDTSLVYNCNDTLVAVLPMIRSLEQVGDVESG